MSHHGKTVIARHEERIVAEMRRLYLGWYGADALARRERELAALPAVEWKGRTLRAIQCHGDYGKGPHVVNLPESVLWNLLGFDRYRCVYHSR
jgi:hypothetical protein